MTESKMSKDNNKEVKIFKDLDEEIIQTNLCCACGACIAYCESQSFDVIEMDDYTPKFKAKANEDNCTECGLCYYICPQTNTLLDQLDATYCVEDEIGNIKNILAAKTSQETIKEVGQDGGVVTTILKYLFDKNKIDAAIVSEFDKELRPIPKIIFDKEELLNSAGTRYSISSQILPLKDLYNISEEIQHKKGIFNIDQLRIAFVGTPCQVRAIRKMKHLSIKPAHVVNYVISLYCFENFDYYKLYELLEKEEKLKPEDIKKEFIKKNFFIETKDDKKVEVSIKKLDPAVRNHCHSCDEFTGRFSDISVGSSGAPQGYSMIITRTNIGDEVINSLLSLNYIEQLIIPRDEMAEWKDKKLNFYKKMISRKG